MNNKIIKTKDGRMFYIGQDNTSTLQHWKYIKKERGKNGKWRYYYHDDELENKIYTTNKASKEKKEKADRLYDQAMDRQKKLDDLKKELDDAIATEKNLYEKLDINAKLGNLNSDNLQAKIDHGKAVEQRKQLEAKYHYMRSNIDDDVKAGSRFDRESVKLSYDAKDYQKELDSSFGSKVADALNSASDVISKGKTWLENLFKSKR